LKQAPDDAAFHVLKALLETLQKNPKDAQKSYERAIELDANNLLAYLGLAKLALDNGQFDKAKDYANKSLVFNNKAINAYFVLADIAYQQKDNAEVENILVTAYKKVQGTITAEREVIKNLGKFYVMQKQPEKILPLAEALVQRYPNDSTALSALAGAQLANNQKVAAEQTLLKLINQDKQNVNERLLLAKLISDQPDKEKEVLKLLDETAQIIPDRPEPLVFKTTYLIQLKHYPDALKIASKIDSQFPTSALGKILKGEVYLADKKLDEAREQYQQAYKVQPNDKVLFTLFDIMKTQGQLPEAIKLLNSELAKNPKNGAIHFKLAGVYEQQKDTKQAEIHYQAVLTEQPDNALALNNLAWLYAQQKNPLAIELAKKAYTQAPQSPAIADTYGYILIKQGAVKEGLSILEKAAAAAPQANDIQFHLAEAYSVNENTGKAIEILEAILKTGQDFAEKETATRLLAQLKAN
jgi:putative PEP-CTERM system TPR-repeat lipoprotein